MTTQFTLPRDADDREIPLDTAYMYDRNGNSIKITRWCFTTRLEPLSNKNKWIAIDKAQSIKDPALLYLTSPDSLKKLEEDLKRVVSNEGKFGSMPCAYTNHSDDLCIGCRFDITNKPNCLDKMLEDVISRIHNLENED